MGIIQRAFSRKSGTVNMSCFLLLFLSALNSAAAVKKLGQGPHLEPPEKARAELEGLSLGGAKLHKLIKAGDKARLEGEIQSLQQKIQKLYGSLSEIPHPQKRSLALRLAGLIDERLEGLAIRGIEGSGKGQKRRLFGSFVEIARVYNVKAPEAKVFYCSRDKGLWMQEGSKPQNPISPQFKNCGQRVW